MSDENQDIAIRTYVTGLDNRIEGGIPKGHIVLIAGESGSMKSSLAWNILYNYAKEKKGNKLKDQRNRSTVLFFNKRQRRKQSILNRRTRRQQRVKK